MAPRATSRTAHRRPATPSQGATAALGLARAIQDGADPRFRVGAIAPIAGGYDLRDAEIPALLDGKVTPKLGTAYTTYLLVAWNRLHKIENDEQAVTTNTASCVAGFRARGVKAPVIDVGDKTYEGSRHLGANLAGTARAVRWFSGLNG